MLGTEAPTMTVVWVWPASKQHLKGNKEWIELLEEKKSELSWRIIPVAVFIITLPAGLPTHAGSIQSFFIGSTHIKLAFWLKNGKTDMTLFICFGCWPARSVTSGLLGKSIIKYRDVGFSPCRTMQTWEDHNESIHDKKSHKREITKYDNCEPGQAWPSLASDGWQNSKVRSKLARPTSETLRRTNQSWYIP